jgi:hypothetical protein
VGVLGLTEGQDAEPERVVRVVSDLFPPGVYGVVGEAVRAQLAGVEDAESQCLLRSDRVVANSDVDEILVDECTDSRYVRIVVLFVQIRAAVAREAPRPARRG